MIDKLFLSSCHKESFVQENGLVDTIFCIIGSTDHPSGFQKRVFSQYLLKPSTTVDQETMQLISSKDVDLGILGNTSS